MTALVYCSSHFENLFATDSQVQNWAKDKNRQFPGEKIQSNSKHLKFCLNVLVIRKIRIKKKMGYHFTHFKLTITGKLDSAKCEWR